MPAPVADWTLADLLDFEQLLASPACADEDRRIFVDEIAPRIDARSAGDRRVVFRAWLDVRRARMPHVMVGESYDLGRRSLDWAAVVLGLILGMGLAGALLAPGSSEPVNALLFLVWTVGIQWALLALALLAWVLRRAGIDVAPLRATVMLAVAAAGSLLRRLPGQRRDALRAAFTTLKRRGSIEGSFLKWQAFIVTQQFGVAFNVGLLFAMLFVQLPFAEFRFGWQSTYEIRPEQVHRVVDTLAAPWRWAVPGAQPSGEDIAATRYARGQDAQSMPSRAARSWWPFLALTIFCYGLLFRSVMLACALVGVRRGLKAVSFAGPEANALWRRLRGPLISTAGGSAMPPEPTECQSRRAAGQFGGSCVVLLSEEVTIPEARLSALLSERFGWAVQRVARVSIDDRKSAAAAVASIHPDDQPPAAVVVVAPGSRDPIVAVALFLREVIAAAGDGCEVIVLLCGGAGDEETPVDDERYAIWQRFRAIHQLPLGIER